MRAWQSLGSIRKIVSTYESYARYQWVPMGDLSIKVWIQRCCQRLSGPAIVEHLSPNLDYLELMKCLWILTQETRNRWVEFKLLGED